MARRTTNNLSLIIIDQLRADYDKFMSRCSQLLPFHSECDTRSYPSSTEPTHLSISSGERTNKHGFISKRTRSGNTGVIELTSKFDSEEIIPIAVRAKEKGFLTYVIGGKPETVQVMGRETDCGLRAFYDARPDYKRFKVDGMDVNIKNIVSAKLRTLPAKVDNSSFSRVELDDIILELLNLVMPCEGEKNRLYIASLPGLDEIGHEHGPCSDGVKAHLKTLDKKLAHLIERYNHDITFILTGDHGCRNISRYVIEMGDDMTTMVVYNAMNGCLAFMEKYALEAKETIHKIEYDGGNLRIWFKDQAVRLTPNDISFLNKYGEIQPSKDKEKKRHHLRSKHINQGDITYIAYPDVMFCKTAWIYHEGVKERISELKDLQKGDLPKGEHGTYYDKDRLVAFMSNYDFGLRRITNTMIPKLIRRIM